MIDLNDPKQKATIRETLKAGQATEFWAIIVQSLNDSIAHLQKEQDGESMADLPPERYKVEAEILKSKRANLEKLKNMPTDLSSWLTSPDQTQPNFDPYATAEDLTPKEEEE